MSRGRLTTAIAAVSLCAAALASISAGLPAATSLPPGPPAVAVRLVRDINRLPADANPRNFFNLGSETYFSATSPRIGQELWKTDGTEAGTKLVRDINPGPGGSSPEQFTHVNSEIFFAATDGSAAHEIWKTNGTRVGTKLVKVISVADSGREPYLWLGLGRRLIFAVGPPHLSGSRPASLWVSDGTARGTHPLDNITAATCSPGLEGFFGDTLLPFCVARDHGALLFENAGDGRLWRTDGTARGTYEVSTVPMAGAENGASNLAVLNGGVYFLGRQSSRYGLYRTDGLPGNSTLIKSVSNAKHWFPAVLAMNGHILFFDLDNQNYFKPHNPKPSTVLWKSDGTTKGTVEVRHISGDIDADGTLVPASPRHPLLLFFGISTRKYGDELWVSDGTSAGTHLVRDITPHGNSNPNWLTPLKIGGESDLLFDVLSDDGKYDGLWRTDGTKQGTRHVVHLLVLDLAAAPSPGGQVVLFEGQELGNAHYHGVQLWESNGTKSATRILKVIDPETQDGVYGTPGAMLNTKTFIFSGDDGMQAQQPWRTDGTSAGTMVLDPIDANDADSEQYDYVRAGKLVFFLGCYYLEGLGGGTSNYEVFSTDGTLAGTSVVSNFVSPCQFNYQRPENLVAVGNEVFFSGNNGTHGYELWKTDGEAASMVKDINPSGDSHPSTLTDVGGKLYFVADDGVHGAELWRSDGTEPGTVMVRDINPGPAGSSINAIGHLGSELYFGANDGRHGTELWKSDGTAAGTTMLKDVNPGPASSNPQDFTSFAGRIYFEATGRQGAELWSSDRTAVGTRVVDDIHPGPLGSNPSNLTVAAGRLFFTAEDGVHGDELWSTVGSRVTTRMVRDINPGAASSSPSLLTRWNGALWLIADDGIHGQELWTSDGTRKGTRLARDIFPGKLGSGIGWMVPADRRLYFSADDGVHGLELWSAS
jgi:ELWxxDGT repeat protein